MTTPKNENVAVFNPLVLLLPNWHPDGPDGDIDGFVIPFVFPDDRPSGRTPNRRAMIRVYPDGGHGWRAALRNCQDHAETAEQARAFAGAWIRAAEILENVAKRQPAADVAEHQDDEVVDAEVVEDDGEDQDAGVVLRGDYAVRVLYGEHAGREGRIASSTITEGEPTVYGVLLNPDGPGRRGFETVPIVHGALEVIDAPTVTSCPACSAGSCTLHPARDEPTPMQIGETRAPGDMNAADRAAAAESMKRGGW